jgi:glycosyltransferase involved in cell wall biosynthesis
MQTKKTILLFIDWYLPGYKAGGPIQSCANLVDHLKGQFNFKIITRDTDYCETQAYTNVKSNAWNKLDENTQVYYFSTDQINKKNIHHLIDQTSFDVVYLNGIFSYFFTIVPLLYFRKNKSQQVIIAARGMLASGALAIKKRKKQVFLKFAKLLRLFHKVIFHATSEAEKQDIINVMGAQSVVKIAGNLSKKISLPAFEPRNKEKGRVKLVNIARIAPEKNLLYALELLRNVKSIVQFDFYGPIYEDTYYQECKIAIEKLPSNVRVNYKGVIPNSEVNSTLSSYDAMLMPTLGENFGHIILESLIAACPVIISDQTPWQNLEEIKAGWAIPLNQQVKFVEVIALIAQMETNEFNQFSHGAYQMAKNFIDNKALISSNRALFE